MAVGTSDNTGSSGAGAGTGAGSGGTSNTASAAVARAVVAASSAAEGGTAGIPEGIVKAANVGATEEPTEAVKPGTEEPGEVKPEGVKPDGVVKPEGAEAAGVKGDARFQTVARNVRTNTVKEIRTALGMKDGETTAHVRRDLDLVRQWRSNPTAFAQQLVSELAAKGINVGAAEAGTGVGTGAGERTTSAKRPEPNLQSEDGKYKTYDAERLGELISYEVGQALEGIRGELKPTLDFVKGQQGSAEKAEADRRGQQTAAMTLRQARAFPHFKENEAEITKRLIGITRHLNNTNPELYQQIGPVGILHIAYSQVMRDIVLPKLGQTSEQKVRDENRRKLAASNGHVAPNSGGGDNNVPKLKQGDVNGLASHMEKLAERASA